MPRRDRPVFPAEDNAGRSRAHAERGTAPDPSIWGHFAGGPGTNPVDVAFLDDKLKELLASG